MRATTSLAIRPLVRPAANIIPATLPALLGPTSSSSSPRPPPYLSHPPLPSASSRLLPPSMSLNFLRNIFSSASPQQAAMASQKAQKLIDDNAVMVFSKSYCSYCRATKTLLNSLGAKFKAIDLDEEDDGSDIQNALHEMTGQRSVPNIFVKQKHIGGNSDIQSLHSSGKLEALLTEAGAL